MIDKRYLGCGVYVGYDGYHLILTTENGSEEKNRVMLNPSVLEALNKYLTYFVEKKEGRHQNDR